MKIPINDFVDDLVDNHEKNKNPYILIVMDRDGQGARVTDNIDAWVTAGERSVREDVIQLLDETIFKEETV
jgi:hypothetical protein